MNTETPGDAYELVLADLRAKRDQIDQAIALIQSLRHGGALIATGAMSVGASVPGGVSPQIEKSAVDALGPGAFLGMTIADAAKKLLAVERRTLTNAEIVGAFDKGGLVLNSTDKLNTVGSVLNRRFQQVGDVVRISRGTWGLKEWYPNRTFKPAGTLMAIPPTPSQTSPAAASGKSAILEIFDNPEDMEDGATIAL